MESIELDTISREISDSVAGYIVHGAEVLLGLISGLKTKTAPSRAEYFGILSRGELITPSEALGDVVAQCFAVPYACSSVIRESKPPSKRLAVALLQKFIEPSGLVCTVHDRNFSLRVMEDVCNGYFAGQAKRSREKVKEDCCPEKKETSESIDEKGFCIE